MNKSDDIKELAIALCKVQSQLTGAKKDSENPFFKSKYADLESVWDSIRKPMSDNGLSVTQFPCTMENGVPGLETILIHASGQFISNTVPVVSIKQDPQSYGSAFTYFRRYALSAVVGQIQTDDDGNQAQGSNQTKENQSESKISKNTSQYIIPFGKFKGKGLGEVNAEDLKSYAEYIRNTAEKDNKPLNDTVQELLERIDAL